MCIVSSGHRFLERVSKSKGLITFTMYFLMVGLATIGIFGKTQYPDRFTPRWVNACMISSGLCCVLGLATACLVTNKNVDSQTPDGATPGSAALPASVTPQVASAGAQLSQMYNTQVSPVLTVSVLDMDVTTGRSTFLPLIGYPVNHDFNLQLLLPNRYGNAEQILGVHLPQNGEPGQVHQTIVQAHHTDGKTSNEKTVLADHLKRIASEAKHPQDGKTTSEFGGYKDNNGNVDNDNNGKKVETPPPSYSSLEISVQCGPGGNTTGTGGEEANAAAAVATAITGGTGAVGVASGQPGTTNTSLERRVGMPRGDQDTREREQLQQRQQQEVLLRQQPQRQRQPQQQQSCDQTERTERPPSYDTALCRLAENATEDGDEGRGAVGGVAITLEPLATKLSANLNITKDTSTRDPLAATGIEIEGNASKRERV